MLSVWTCLSVFISIIMSQAMQIYSCWILIEHGLIWIHLLHKTYSHNEFFFKFKIGCLATRSTRSHLDLVNYNYVITFLFEHLQEVEAIQISCFVNSLPDRLSQPQSEVMLEKWQMIDVSSSRNKQFSLDSVDLSVRRSLKCISCCLEKYFLQIYQLSKMAICSVICKMNLRKFSQRTTMFELASVILP